MRIRVAASATLVLALLAAGVIAQRPPRSPSQGKSWVAGPSYDSENISANLPPSEQIWNIGSKLDGAGMCVDTSIEMAALYADLEEYRGFRDYWSSHARGGNYPEGVDRQLAAYAKLKGLPAPQYVQYEGKDVGAVLDAIDRTGRMACITYGYSPRYGNQTIAHMVCSPKYNGKYGVVRDNNKIGGVDGTEDHLYEWMSRDELIKRICWPSGSGWVFVWLNPAPAPPVPAMPNRIGESGEAGPFYTLIVAERVAGELRQQGYRADVVPTGRGWFVRYSKG